MGFWTRVRLPSIPFYAKVYGSVEPVGFRLPSIPFYAVWVRRTYEVFYGRKKVHCGPVSF